MYFTPYGGQGFCPSGSPADKQIPNCWASTSHGPDRNSISMNGMHQSPTSWVHTVPSYMPWVTKQNHMTQPGIMRFTASSSLDPCTSQTATSWELLHNLGQTGGPHTGVHHHLKRRSESPESMKPSKQFITEERMAARFNQLHISNEYQTRNVFGASSGSNSRSQKDSGHSQKPVKTLEELEAIGFRLIGPHRDTIILVPITAGLITRTCLMLQDGLANELSDESDVEDENKESKGGIVLSPELKRLVDSTPLTKPVIEKVSKPSMALVVWQPPGECIKEKIKAALSSSSPNSSASRDSSSTDKDLMNTDMADNNNSCSFNLNTLGEKERHPSVLSFSSLPSNSVSYSELDTMDDDIAQLEQMLDDEMDDL